MKKQFIGYDLAQKLKELGFKELVSAYYKGEVYAGDGTEGVFIYSDEWFKVVNDSIVAAPLWQQAFDFIRVKFDIMPHIYVYTNGSYDYDTYSDNPEETETAREFKTFEEAREACLLEMIEMAEELKTNLKMTNREKFLKLAVEDDANTLGWAKDQRDKWKAKEILLEGLADYPIDQIRDLPLDDIVKSMQQYARECAKASLIKASDTLTKWEFERGLAFTSQDIITNPENIVLL